MKDGPDGEMVASKLVVVKVAIDDDGEPITSCVVEPAEGVIANQASKPVTRLPDAAKIALGSLRKAVDEAGEIAPASNHIPAAARVVSVETWRRYHYIGTAADGQNTDSREKAFQRAREKLQAAGAIGLHNDFCWIVADV